MVDRKRTQTLPVDHTLHPECIMLFHDGIMIKHGIIALCDVQDDCYDCELCAQCSQTSGSH